MDPDIIVSGVEFNVEVAATEVGQVDCGVGCDNGADADQEGIAPGCGVALDAGQEGVAPGCGFAVDASQEGVGPGCGVALDADQEGHKGAPGCCGGADVGKEEHMAAEAGDDKANVDDGFNVDGVEILAGDRDASGVIVDEEVHGIGEVDSGGDGDAGGSISGKEGALGDNDAGDEVKLRDSDEVFEHEDS